MMIAIVGRLACVLVAGICIIGCGRVKDVQGSSPGTATVPRFTRGLSEGILRDYPGENVVLSPASVRVLLSFLADASNGATSAEIRATLGSSYYAQPSVSASRDLRSATNAWISPGYHTTSEFAKVAAAKYRVHVGKIEPGLKAVRDWAKRNGGGNLRGIHIAPSAILIAANITTYQGEWSSRFNPALTKPGIFHGAHGLEHAMFMHQMGYFPIFRGRSGDMVALNYSNGFSMYLFMPSKTTENPLATMLDSMNSSELVRSNVAISLPKMKLDCILALPAALQRQGIRVAFTANADFAPIMGVKDTPLSMVQTESEVRFDERGTRVASLTVADIELKGALNLNFDKPFAFVILNNKSDEAVLVGQVVDATGV